MHGRTTARMDGTGRRTEAWWLRALGHVCLCAVVGASAACASGQAKTLVELPPLEMPAPPPRVVEVAEPQQPPLVALPEQPRTTIRQPSPPPQRTDAPRAAEPTRTEPPPTDAGGTPEEVARPGTTTLQTTPTQREGEVERRIRILIAQAFNDLNRVDYQGLNANARNQYDTAKRFAVQAEEALQARNLVFASNLADKAAALAAQLLGR